MNGKPLRWMIWAGPVLVSLGAAGVSTPAGEPPAVTVGVEIHGPERPSDIEAFALAELRAAAAGSARAVPTVLVVGQANDNAKVKKMLDAGFTKPETRREGYALRYDKAKGLVLVAGADDRGALYGVMDLIHYRLADILSGKAESFAQAEAPRIEYRGIWGWGGPIRNYEKFFDQMARWKMNLCIPWHDKVPKNAKAFQDYAASRGVYVAWGYTWGWPAIDWKSDATIQKTSETAVQVFKEQYAPLKPWGIYFQSHTEYGAGGGVGDKWVGLVNKTSAQILETQPDLKIFAGLHGTFSRPKHEDVMKLLDARVDVMYEDIGSASHYVVNASKPTAVDLNRTLAAIRGEKEKIGYVYKGFTQQMGGADPGLEKDEARLRSAANVKWRAWALNEGGWRQHFAGWNEVLRSLAESKAERKSVTLLIEGGLWEYRPWWPGCLLAEGLWDPARAPEETIRRLDACPYAFSALRNAPQPEDPSQLVKHEAVGKAVKLSHPFDGNLGRPGVASVSGAAGLVDGVLARRADQTDPWWHGLNPHDFEAVVDMGAETTIRQVSARFLTAFTPTPSFFPEQVEWAVSGDGENFKVIATVKIDPEKDRSGIKVYETANLNEKGRYVRVRAPHPTVPSWHHCKGDKALAWLFLDELVINRAEGG